MKISVVIILLLTSVGVQAQHFVESQSIKLNKSITNTLLESADFNNDGLPDVIMFNTNTSGEHHIQFIKNDSTDGFLMLHDSTDILIEAFSGYSILDYDNDNDIDILLYGSASYVYLNEGGFTFLKRNVNLPPFTIARWVDLDNNGSREIIGSFTMAGEASTCVYKQRPDNTWQQIGNTLKLALNSLEILDADSDGYKDLFVSGSHSADSLFTGFLINNKDFHFAPSLGKSYSGNAAAGDLNEDGFFDVAFVGLDSVSGIAQKVWLSKNGKYVIRDSTFVVTSGSLFISDLNADGRADISAIGKNLSADTVHTILFATGSVETTTIQRLKSQQFLDFNRDGNLDIVRATQPDSIHITFYTNQSAENKGPAAPGYAIANKIFDRYFFFWAPSTDDHTNSKSLTYDFFLQGDGIFQPAEFDLANERRLLTSHGNTLTQNFKLFDQLPSDPLAFGIQAVDNSFQAIFQPNGLCVGTVGLCPLLESGATIMQVCPFETVTISSPPASLWFSFSKGYLGAYDALEYTAAASDTLFYYDPNVFDCTALKAFIIHVRNISSVEHYTRYACENQRIEFEAEQNWQSVQWSSALEGNLGQSSTVQYTVTANDSIFALLKGQGCSVLRKTAVIISRPVITVEHDQLAILKGSTVELEASGGIRYEWSPAAGLSDPSISNPVASPVTTTVYTVTGYDSVTCSAEASVTITVESAGFVPNLFTPNDDGKNDLLKIYGLREAREFSFTVYNREGKIVYETRSPSEVSALGWDGRKNGKNQPSGVYFWKVKGQHPSGEDVKLNGKSEGSIILVR